MVAPVTHPIPPGTRDILPDEMRELRRLEASLAEVFEVLGAALDQVGLGRAMIGIGDADLYRQLLDELGVAGEERDRVLACLAMHDLADLELEVARLEGIGAAERETLIELPSMR